MLETINELFLDALIDRIAERLSSSLLPQLETSLIVQPRWLSVASAAAYIDKTIPGMRHTLKEHSADLPFSKFGGAPRIDREDIDRLGLNSRVAEGVFFLHL
jgi:hypothetical protein